MMPRLVQRLVAQFAAPGAPRDQQRVLALLDILGGYGLIPALKGIMATLHDDRAWLRVRPPLVALGDAEYRRLAAQIRAFGIDPASD
jgi:4-hydroxy-tetrahydrodipicolinate synthase